MVLVHFFFFLCWCAVAVDSLDVDTFVADGEAKRVVVSGNKMDKTRDTAKIVLRSDPCASGAAVGSATVDSSGAGATDTALDVDLAMSAAAAGAVTEYKLCVRLGATAAFVHYDMSTAGANDLAVVKATSFVPGVLPIGAAATQPLAAVLTVRGDGLLSTDTILIVASGDACDTVTETAIAGTTVTRVSGVAGVEQVYDVTTTAAATGAYKLCHKPTGGAAVEFGEVEGTPAVTLASATGVAPSFVVADGTAKRVVVSGAQLDRTRDSLRVIARAGSCASGAAVGTAVVDGAGATGASLDVDVSISAAAAGGASAFKLCIRYGSDASDRFYEFETANAGDLNVVAAASVAPTAVPVQPAVMSALLTLTGTGLSAGDTLVFADVGETCTGTVAPTVTGTPPTLAENTVTADTEITFDVTTTTASPGDFKLCLLPAGAGSEYGELAGVPTITVGLCGPPSPLFLLLCFSFPFPFSLPLPFLCSLSFLCSSSFLCSLSFLCLSFFLWCWPSLSLSLRVRVAAGHSLADRMGGVVFFAQ